MTQPPGIEEIEDDDIRLLIDSPAPTPVFTAPRPVWLNTLSNWRTFAALDRTRPDLADSPPPGTKVADNDLRLRYHALMPTVVTPAIGRALVVVHEHLLANRERIHGKTGIIIEGPAAPARPRSCSTSAATTRTRSPVCMSRTRTASR